MKRFLQRKPHPRSGASAEPGGGEAEQTLRLLARAEPPSGLEERIQNRLRQACPGQARLGQDRLGQEPANRSSARAWRDWLPGFRPGFLPGLLPRYGAAAAALLCLAAGAAYYVGHVGHVGQSGQSGHSGRSLPPATNFHGASSAPSLTDPDGKAVSPPLLAPPAGVPRGSFGSAGSMRVPPTLKPLYVPESSHGKPATKPVGKPGRKQGSKAVSVPVDSPRP